LLAGALTKVAAGRSLDYYEEFNASSRTDVDVQSKSSAWVIVTMDGELKIADGTHAERLVPDEATREVPIRAPIAWKTIPANAMFVVARRASYFICGHSPPLPAKHSNQPAGVSAYAEPC